MALISDLVSELHAISGIPERSVSVVARHLREAGLLSQRGRGRSAARATPRDAARLLIALMVGGQAKEAPRAVADFGQLRCWSAECPPDHRYREFSLGRLCGLGDGHNFEDGLAGLIAVWGDPTVVEEMEAASRPLGPLPGMLARLKDSALVGEVYFGGSHYCYCHAALLEANALGAGRKLQEIAEEHSRLTEEYLAVARRYFSGIRSAREVSGVELRPLGETVAGLRPAGGRASEEEPAAAPGTAAVSSGGAASIERDVRRCRAS